MNIFNMKYACGAVLLGMCGSAFAASTTGNITFTVSYTQSATFEVKDGGSRLADKSVVLARDPGTGKLTVSIPLEFYSNQGSVRAKLASSTNKITHSTTDVNLEVLVGTTRLGTSASSVVSASSRIVSGITRNLIIQSVSPVGILPVASYSGTVGIEFESEF